MQPRCNLPVSVLGVVGNSFRPIPVGLVKEDDGPIACTHIRTVHNTFGDVKGFARPIAPLLALHPQLDLAGDHQLPLRPVAVFRDLDVLLETDKSHLLALSLKKMAGGSVEGDVQFRESCYEIREIVYGNLLFNKASVSRPSWR